MSFTFKLQSPKAMNNVNADGRSSDLLPFCPVFPSRLLIATVTNEWTTVMELTAAGQFRSYTWFPFNPLWYYP